MYEFDCFSVPHNLTFLLSNPSSTVSDSSGSASVSATETTESLPESASAISQTVTESQAVVFTISPSSAPSADTTSSNHLPAIIGGIVGGLTLAILLVTCLFVRRIRQARKCEGMTTHTAHILLILSLIITTPPLNQKAVLLRCLTTQPPFRVTPRCPRRMPRPRSQPYNPEFLRRTRTCLRRRIPPMGLRSLIPSHSCPSTASLHRLAQDPHQRHPPRGRTHTSYRLQVRSPTVS